MSNSPTTVGHPAGWLHTDGGSAPLRSRPGELLNGNDGECWRVRFLADASAVLGGSLDVEEILQQLADLTVPHLADWCVIDVVDGGQLVPAAAAHADPTKTARVRTVQAHYVYDDPHGPGKVARTGEPELLETVTDEQLAFLAHDHAHLALMRALQPGSAVAVPLFARGRSLGAITLVRSAWAQQRYTATDLDMLQEMAHRAAIAIDNAALYTERARTARMLQQALLPPSLPDPPGLALAAAYDTADDADIGGDFYDVIATDQGWLMVLGDVCGKGVEAAALSSLARHTVHAAALHHADPAGVLGVLNDALTHHECAESFCTAVCAHLRLDTDPARVTIASGGHPPALVRRRDGDVEPVNGDGTLLGVFDDPQLTATDVTLRAGDLVLLYTDGLSEARRRGQLFGVEGLAAALGAAAKLDADALVAHVHAAAESWQDSQRDDMAVLAAQLRPSPPGAAARTGRPG